jgi:hypothetical protein
MDAQVSDRQDMEVECLAAGNVGKSDENVNGGLDE